MALVADGGAAELVDSGMPLGARPVADGRVWADRVVPPFRLHRGSIHAGARPVDLTGKVRAARHVAMDLIPQAGILPANLRDVALKAKVTSRNHATAAAWRRAVVSSARLSAGSRFVRQATMPSGCTRRRFDDANCHALELSNGALGALLDALGYGYRQGGVPEPLMRWS